MSDELDVWRGGRKASKNNSEVMKWAVFDKVGIFLCFQKLSRNVSQQELKVYRRASYRELLSVQPPPQFYSCRSPPKDEIMLFRSTGTSYIICGTFSSRNFAESKKAFSCSKAFLSFFFSWEFTYECEIFWWKKVSERVKERYRKMLKI